MLSLFRTAASALAFPFRTTPFNAAQFSAMASPNVPTETAIFAAGCFWGVEHIFLKHYPPAQSKGVLTTAVGYIGGNESTASNPSYEQVCSGRTGHAEALKVEFDPSKVEYAELVEFFYRTHDPTTVDRQGNDRGSQYRSALFTLTPEQAETAKRVTEDVQAKHFTPKGQKIATKIHEATKFHPAEEPHQLYLHKNPYGYQCATHRLHW